MAPTGRTRDALSSHLAQDRIRALESLSHTDDPRKVWLVIERLDDEDIRVRGEAFGALMLNENDIAGVLLGALSHRSSGVRAYAALVLANRGCVRAVPEIIRLTGDKSAMVRACAIGALGYMGAAGVKEAIERCLGDGDVEVRRSAASCAVRTGNAGLLRRAGLADGDPEIRRIIESAGGR